MYMQRFFDYYPFAVGLGQCSLLSYLEAQPPVSLLHSSHADHVRVDRRRYIDIHTYTQLYILVQTQQDQTRPNLLRCRSSLKMLHEVIFTLLDLSYDNWGMIGTCFHCCNCITNALGHSGNSCFIFSWLMHYVFLGYSIATVNTSSAKRLCFCLRLFVCFFVLTITQKVVDEF